MVATDYANPNVEAVDLRTTLRVALRAHSPSNNRPERNENCVTHVAGLKCYLCWRLQKAVKPLRGESRLSRLYLSNPCAFLCYPLHTAMRAQSAPGFPCALSSERDNKIAKLGRNLVAGMRTHVQVINGCHRPA